MASPPRKPKNGSRGLLQLKACQMIIFSERSKQIQVQLDPNGNVELFVLGTDNTVYTSSRGATGWAAFTGAAGGPGTRVDQMVVGRNQNGTPEIFAIQFNTFSPDKIWSETQDTTGA